MTSAAKLTVMTSVKHPPGPTQTWLGETIVHSEDIRRALGIQHKYPDRRGRDGGGLLQGLEPPHRLEEPHRRTHAAGHRRELEPRQRPRGIGPILSLVVAMTGRKQADDDLAGDGVATLRSRSG
jgi:hypothetical protein